jgi:hypothetical protein
MKKSIVLIVLIAIFTLSANAQYWYNKYYPDKNLIDLNSDELYSLLEKSNSTYSKGKTICLVGLGITAVSITVIFGNIFADIARWEFKDEEYYGMMILGIMGGAALTIVGLPVLLTGKSRRNTISSRLVSLGLEPYLSIAPELHYNNNNGYSPGVSLTISF